MFMCYCVIDYSFSLIPFMHFLIIFILHNSLIHSIKCICVHKGIIKCVRVIEDASVPLLFCLVSAFSTPLITAVTDHRHESSSLPDTDRSNTAAHASVHIQLLIPYSQPDNNHSISQLY